jgi:hypothetical protein
MTYYWKCEGSGAPSNTAICSLPIPSNCTSECTAPPFRSGNPYVGGVFGANGCDAVACGDNGGGGGLAAFNSTWIAAGWTTTSGTYCGYDQGSSGATDCYCARVSRGTCQAAAACVAATINNCLLTQIESGNATNGICSTGFTGACNFSCSQGNWSSVSNTCVASNGHWAVQGGYSGNSQPYPWCLGDKVNSVNALGKPCSPIGNLCNMWTFGMPIMKCQ